MRLKIIALTVALSSTGCAAFSPSGFNMTASVGMHRVDTYHQEERTLQRPLPYICAFWHIPGKCDVAGQGNQQAQGATTEDHS